MNSERAALERALQQLRPEPGILERVELRRHRKQRTQRIAATTVALALVAAGALGVLVVRSDLAPPPSPPASPPASPTPVQHLAMHNGSIDVFGFTDGVKTLGPDGVGGFVVKCGGSCTEIFDAAWSPDGTRLAFSASCGGGCGSAGDPYHGVRVADPSTGVDRLILPGDGIGPIAWSPDGARIAYVTHGRMGPDGWEWERTYTLRVMNADGTQPVDLLPGLPVPAAPESIAWSPDGSHLVISDRSGAVTVVGSDGSAPTTLTRGSHAAWSPDGKTIAYVTGCDVRSITPDGLDDRSLVNLLQVTPAAAVCGGVGDLEWSPDGTRLVAFANLGSADPGPYRKAVFVLHADGSGARLVSGSNGFSRGLDPVEGLTWRPIR